jgi:hypothetical protein
LEEQIKKQTKTNKNKTLVKLLTGVNVSMLALY